MMVDGGWWWMVIDDGSWWLMTSECNFQYLRCMQHMAHGVQLSLETGLRWGAIWWILDWNLGRGWLWRLATVNYMANYMIYMVNDAYFGYDYDVANLILYRSNDLQWTSQYHSISFAMGCELPDLWPLCDEHSPAAGHQPMAEGLSGGWPSWTWW